MDITGYSTDYTDPSTGANFPEAWINPNPIIYIFNTYISLQVNVYKDESAYNSGKNPISSINEVIIYDSQDWLTYFDTTVLQQEGIDFLSQCYSWMKTKYPENQ